MKWEDYRGIYLDYEMTVTQTRLSSVISQQVLEDFPKNIPKEIEPFARGFRRLKEIAETLMDYKKAMESQSTNSISKRNESISDKSNNTDELDEARFIDEFFTLFTLIAKRGIKLTDIDFRRIQLAQELVMHYSNFEGILSDNLRTACCVCPDIMKKTKTLQWEEVLSCGSWNRLLDMLVEKFVRDMGWTTLQKRLNIFTDFLNLDVHFDEEDAGVIKEVELTRNLIVHNGGKVNREYLRLKKAKNLKVGDYIPLDNDFLKLASITFQMLASEIYTEISKKYFGKNEDEILEEIWNRRDL